MKNLLKLNIISPNGISQGAGFSTDMQQIAPNICFDSTISSITGKEGHAQLGEARLSLIFKKN